MSKKKRVKKNKKINQINKDLNRVFSSFQEVRIRNLIIQQTFALEQSLKKLFSEFEILKANVITSNSLLEKKEILNKEEFFAEFEEIQKQNAVQKEVTGGRIIYSLYNDDTFKEKGEKNESM